MFLSAFRWQAALSTMARGFSSRPSNLLLDKGIKTTSWSILWLICPTKFESIFYCIPSGFINGVWVGSSSNKTFDVSNPSTGKIITQVADMGRQETEAAIDAAYTRFHSKDWQSLTAKDRSNLLKVSQWHNYLKEIIYLLINDNQTRTGSNCSNNMLRNWPTSWPQNQGSHC